MLIILITSLSWLLEMLCQNCPFCRDIDRRFLNTFRGDNAVKHSPRFERICVIEKKAVKFIWQQNQRSSKPSIAHRESFFTLITKSTHVTDSRIIANASTRIIDKIYIKVRRTFAWRRLRRCQRRRRESCWRECHPILVNTFAFRVVHDLQRLNARWINLEKKTFFLRNKKFYLNKSSPHFQ